MPAASVSGFEPIDILWNKKTENLGNKIAYYFKAYSARFNTGRMRLYDSDYGVHYGASAESLTKNGNH